MGSRDWIIGWSRRASQVLAEAEIPQARAGLVDTNGDGRELWFGLDVLSPAGQWVTAADWDDVSPHHEADRVAGFDIVVGWNQARPREERTVEFDGQAFAVRCNRAGWWLLLAAVPGQP